MFVFTPFLPAIRLPLPPAGSLDPAPFAPARRLEQLFPASVVPSGRCSESLTWTLQEEERGQALAPPTWVAPCPACWALSQVLNTWPSLASAGTWRAQPAIGLFLTAVGNNWELIEGGSRRDTDLSLKPSHASPLKYNIKPGFVVKVIRDYMGGKKKEGNEGRVGGTSQSKLSNF